MDNQEKQEIYQVLKKMVGNQPGWTINIDLVFDADSEQIEDLIKQGRLCIEDIANLVVDEAPKKTLL